MPAAGSAFRRGGNEGRGASETVSNRQVSARQHHRLEAIATTIATVLCALAVGLVIVNLVEITDASRSAADAKSFGPPSLSLSQASGPVGTSVTVTGTNFPHTAVQLSWDGTTAGMPSATANGRGSFRATFVVPGNAAPGTHTVAASASSSTPQTQPSATANCPPLEPRLA